MRQRFLTCVILLFAVVLSGCSMISFWGPDGNVLVEMPRPIAIDVVEEKTPTQVLAPNTHNIEQIVSGLVLPENFVWQGIATYYYGTQEREYRSIVTVSGNRFHVQVFEEDKLESYVINDGENIYILYPTGSVAQKIAARNDRFTYQTIAMLASIGSVLPTDEQNRKEVRLDQYREKNCVYVEIQNNKILEKYYLDAQWGYPLYMESSGDEAIYYSFWTQSFIETPIDESLFVVND